MALSFVFLYSRSVLTNSATRFEGNCSALLQESDSGSYAHDSACSARSNASEMLFLRNAARPRSI